jgi:hypothetical protein
MENLRIQSVRRICDFIPRRPCLDTLYTPFPFGGVLYTMGGHLDAVQPAGLTDPNRFADKIYSSSRLADGTYDNPQQLIGKTLFPWMSDETFLTAHPEAFIGSVGGPNLIQTTDGVSHMLFAASVNDPNICCAEHANPTPHGSCSIPWSYFAMFHARSAAGGAWQLVDSSRPNQNRALQHASVYYPPPSNADLAHEYKGVTGISGIVPLGGLYYIPFGFWTSGGQRNAVLRTSDFLQFELWDGGATWDTVVDGLLPDWLNDGIWRGNPFAHLISSVATQSLVPGFQFVLTAQPTGNYIEMAYSNDMTTWTAPQQIASNIPTLSGAGASNVVLFSRYVEDAAGAHILFSSNDLNYDGQPDCGGPYVGLAIHDAPVIVAGPQVVSTDNPLPTAPKTPRRADTS